MGMRLMYQSWGVEYGNEADVSKLGSGAWE